MCRLCLLCVVTINLFLPLTLMPCSFIMRRTRSLPTRMPRATSSFHILGQPYSCWTSAWMARIWASSALLLNRMLAPGFGGLSAPRRRMGSQKAAGADAQKVTGKRYHPPLFVIGNPGVLHFDTRAEYAVAFPRISRSILRRAFWACSLVSSICSGLTGLPRLP